MKKLFGFGSSTPPPPPVPTRPPAPPAKSIPTAKPAAAPLTQTPSAASTPSIVGRWKEPSGTDTTEFHADGSVTEKSGGETIRGKYVFEGGKLKINLEGMSEALLFSAAINNGALEMTDAEGQATTYVRA